MNFFTRVKDCVDLFSRFTLRLPKPRPQSEHIHTGPCDRSSRHLMALRTAAPSSAILRRAFSTHHLTAPSLSLRAQFCTSTSPSSSTSPTTTPSTPPSRRVPIRGEFTRSHFEERIVPFTPQQIYDIVANVDDYHTFVPWCNKSVVTRRVDDRNLIADLSVGFRFLSENYTSVITLDPSRAVSADVPHSNLFEYLINDWEFEPHGQAATNLSFYVEFAFRNPIYQRVTDLFFEEVVKSMVTAFERQCAKKYHINNGGILHRW